ncbi:MAG: UvrD-helicase domain-containing protein, partial [Fluviicola sp.]
MIEQEVNYKPLLILNASAGSGKTFNLVRYYLKLVLRTENPVPVSKILAMTFTNKASNEMKSRIMGELFKIAHA